MGDVIPLFRPLSVEEIEARFAEIQRLHEVLERTGASMTNAEVLGNYGNQKRIMSELRFRGGL
ncbi:MAG: hypothetical protein RLZZ324_84, partial [Candidatus Parcubacteria bacterium]